ncbi:zinc finger protein 277-like [Amphibalanus amphitrite]|uniref:zinc finger protein 277-like n=1 Tax=Amphibalanus amphitrite TaxID=1232801 RepID=UPI001C926872|nr:zinc finger protein 277-like [Amphibalanus amphitrite]XP_043234871.1 zinc finger protein 277-like [Amphibalanus amphitrite]XP_043234872.1 zinc finger protein 277-like [Amphibalanus amphitrite]XP_043234873.1 zinc finger protein 277-like [Amphibalanus amphitrite]XP_043234874.1 zinc finger protein 277-like [Amphibalanus amphitrite]
MSSEPDTIERLVDQRFDSGPSLSFPCGDPDPGAEGDASADQSAPLPCLCCSAEFPSSDRDALSAHLLSEHCLVVADLALVADLDQYCRYWAPRLRADGGLRQYCFTVLTNTGPSDAAPSEEYFLLSPKLDEDRLLRERLQRARLERVLARQQRERTMTFSRGCLFCRLQYSGRLAGFFDHLAEAHNFSVGRPDNIVFGPEFIDAIEAKLEALRCLFCDGVFPDRATLKEHMRKKQHKKINPAHTAFDKFYVINYLEFGKGWQEIQQERDEGPPTGFDEPGSDDDWSDWTEAPSSGAVCLFCDFSTIDVDALSAHMRAEHQFDFPELKSRLRLSFYQQVKLVNYIRRQMVERACLFCQETLPTRATLLEHLRAADHLRVPEPSIWDQPQYFFPTYENDSLLYALEEAEGADDDVPVFPEDAVDVRQSVLADSAVRQELGGHA